MGEGERVNLHPWSQATVSCMSNSSFFSNDEDRIAKGIRLWFIAGFNKMGCFDPGKYGMRTRYSGCGDAAPRVGWVLAAQPHATVSETLRTRPPQRDSGRNLVQNNCCDRCPVGGWVAHLSQIENERCWSFLLEWPLPVSCKLRLNILTSAQNKLQNITMVN